jgi:hypothetical protein
MRKVVLFMAVLAIAGVASAAQTYVQWDGSEGDGNWNNALNWTANVVPSAKDLAGVQANPGYKAGFKTQSSAILNSGVVTTDVLVTGGAAGTADLVVSGATVNVSEYITLAAATNDNGYLIMTSGAINTGVQFNNTSFYVTQNGIGTFDMSGGTLTVGLNYPTPAGSFGTLTIAQNATANGTLNLSGGNIYATAMAKGLGIAVVNITDTDGSIWLAGNESGAMQTAVDDGWLVAGPGLSIEILYDDLADVTQVHAIPEPATICLLGLGVLGLIRRK